MFKKILIANRGEIALRVIRACRDMGIVSVAVYSEIDRISPHVLLADEAYCIGKAPASESYLKAEKIIEVAKKSGAEAIHPGYGFLSENGDFAEMCTENDIVFIGPPSSAIRTMGSKTEARDKMSKAGVPVVPGCEGLGDGTDALKEADRIGYPVMIKAAFGGGGKGMRVVESPGKLLSMLESAEREAKSAFGNGMVYLERYLVNPRHIEIQVLADAFGNVIHLGERECSIQRRHQKVVEESPSPVITTDIRDKMGKAACQAAKACGYINAGTVEFMYADDKFYFLEMNTRLQVEHPVTELVYGIDLVKEQFRIAYGDSISLNQGDILPRGHAIECRIYSEGENFLPEIGTLTDYVVPQGPGVRVDGGVALGSEITVHYDPMISKLLTWGEDRNIAIARMKRALKEYRISGVKTTIPFCLMVMKSESFIDGNYHTGFIEKNFMISENHDEAIIEAAAIAASIIHLDKKNNGKKIYLPKIDSVNKNNWKSSGRSENLM